MRKVKFGQLVIGDRFYWNGVLLKKIGIQLAEIVRNGKMTGKRVEMAHSVTVEID